MLAIRFEHWFHLKSHTCVLDSERGRHATDEFQISLNAYRVLLFVRRANFLLKLLGFLRWPVSCDAFGVATSGELADPTAPG